MREFICNVNWEIFWTAAAAIGTISATVVALFIVKWQDKRSNHKDLKIKWEHEGRVEHEELNDGIESRFPAFHQRIKAKTIDSIVISVLNSGNRKIILENVRVETSPNRFINFESSTLNNSLRTEVSLEIEEREFFPMLYKTFMNTIRHSGKNLNAEIVVTVTDTSGQKYTHNTGIKFSQYLNQAGGEPQ